MAAKADLAGRSYGVWPDNLPGLPPDVVDRNNERLQKPYDEYVARLLSGKRTRPEVVYRLRVEGRLVTIFPHPRHLIALRRLVGKA